MMDKACIYSFVMFAILTTVKTKTTGIHMNQDEIPPLDKIAWMRFLVSVDATKWKK